MNAWVKENRQKLLVGGPIITLIICLFFYLLSGRSVSTDDAYVKAGIVNINANVSAEVSAIYVHDDQIVKQGEPLFQLNQALYQIAVNQAQAQLNNTRLRITALKASYQQQVASVKEAQNNFTYQTQELDRQKKLAASGISSQMQLNHSMNVYHRSEQKLMVEKQQEANILANLGNDPHLDINKHPLVQLDQALLDKAKENLSYTLVKAPIDGIVTKVQQLQLGDYVNAGLSVFALVSNQNIWIEANFKEVQLTHMKLGQKATIAIDAFPSEKFSGHVKSISPGTGSTFSLLPPENATGNWVKVVQRVPVRIAIDNMDKFKSILPSGALSGLSVTVTVDTKSK